MPSQTLEIMIGAAIRASQIIMGFYGQQIDIRQKSDGSPVTLADQRAENTIIERLKATGIPVLGEENVAKGIVPALEGRFFCVDALDGTKEFIRHNDQFTVNIALIENGAPVAGVVCAPCEKLIYAGSSKGAFEYEIVDGRALKLRQIFTKRADAPTLLASRSHRHPHITKLANELGVSNFLSLGSSLKMCRLARGDAQIYPRFAPTCFWDIAAGQAVVEAAGGVVLAISGEPLNYPSDQPSFKNPRFVAAADLALAQKTLAKMRRISQ